MARSAQSKRHERYSILEDDLPMIVIHVDTYTPWTDPRILLGISVSVSSWRQEPEMPSSQKPYKSFIFRWPNPGVSWEILLNMLTLFTQETNSQGHRRTLACRNRGCWGKGQGWGNGKRPEYSGKGSSALMLLSELFQQGL